MTSPWVLGVDSGGSGLRAALAPVEGPVVGPLSAPEPVRTSAEGIDADHLTGLLVPLVERLRAEAGAPVGDPVVAACVGAAGMATLGDQLRARLPGALRASLGVERLALAADAVTAYVGALGQVPGAVVAAGTGMIALGTDLTRWWRADGWGHLLGDCGGGAWIGRAGLEAAMRAHDGREGGSEALLAEAERRFGPAGSLPGQLYPRTDRPAVLASFTREVASAAVAGDAVARRILDEAAREIARSTQAVCPADTESAVALTGGLFGMGTPLLVPLERELSERLPRAKRVEPAGDPLWGSVCVARALAGEGLRLPEEPGLLSSY
ncbi:BadF/BadG/BcrA/BcrD ATPase family protein [Streptomyces sp. NPDC005438]|uniref:N-acetylglucosamine kinase n=1 Tax=Streptomyces sp. NPDC005438 TaxID=3156880 RepID=UPI0033B6EEC9